MSLAFLVAAVASIGAGEPEPQSSVWTLGLTGSYARTEDLDLDSGSIGASIEYGAPDWFVGGSIASTDGASQGEDFESPSDGRGATGSAWAGWFMDNWTFDVTASLSRQDLDGETIAGPDAPPSLRGRTVLVDGQTTSSSVSLGVAHAFQFDGVSVTPHARAGWDRVETETTASLAGSPGGGLAVDSEASGTSASAGLTVSVAPAQWISLFADASAVYASNEAASAFTLGGRTSQSRPVSGSDEGAGWAELSAGVTLFAPAGFAVTLSGGGTAGRDAEDVFASVGVSKSF